jgi:hypothetical protein
VDAFRRSVGSLAEANHIPMIKLKATDRDLDLMRRDLDTAAVTERSQVAAIGVVQEPQRVFIARQRDTEPTNHISLASTAAVRASVHADLNQRWVR